MELPQEIDGFIKEMIDDSLGLPVSDQTLRSRLRAVEEAHHRLRGQYLVLLDELRHKNQLIDRAKAEATMNATALKKFVEENQRLAAECANLVSQCNKLERECSLYDHDREALMDFGNEADERAKEAEIRVRQLEEELGKLSQELQFYKQDFDTRKRDSSSESTDVEEDALGSILATLVSNDEVESGHVFLETNSGYEPCRKMLKMWHRGADLTNCLLWLKMRHCCLKPSTRKILSLAAKVKTLEQDKEHLRINLTRAEEEVNLLFDETKVLDEENKKLLGQLHRERNLDESGGKRTPNSSIKRNKRKSSPKISSPVNSKLDFTDLESSRQPLSTLQHNSPDSRMHKK